MTKLTLNNSKAYNYFYILSVFWIVQVAFFGSFLQSLSFFRTFHWNSYIFYFSLASVVVLFLISLVFKNFFQSYLTVIFNPLVLNYCDFLLKLLSRLLANNSNLPFIIFHGYIAFFLMSLFLQYIGIDDALPFLIYQWFNMCRLFFFPLIIVFFIMNFAPISEYTEKLVVKFVEQAAKEMTERLPNYKKDPKKSVLFYGTAGILASVYYNKYSLQNQLETTLDKYGIDLKNLDPAVLNQLESTESLVKVLKLAKETEKPVFSLFFKQMSGSVYPENDISNHISEDVSEFNIKWVEAKMKRQALDESKFLSFPFSAKSQIGSESKPSIHSVQEIFFFDFFF